VGIAIAEAMPHSGNICVARG